MADMISCCGLVCSDCPAYIATKENDDAKRAEVAALWSKQFNLEINPEDVDCAGCLANGVHGGYCRVCAIRKCAMGKGLDSCARCEDYACEELEKVLSMEPACRERLNKLRGK